MARKTRHAQDASSDDEAPEVVSQSTSKADAKRDQKVLQDFVAEEKARQKVRNQERDQRLKERARVTKPRGRGKDVRGKDVRGKAPLDLDMEGEDENGDKSDDDDDDEGGDDRLEARMLRAMKDAAGEVESGEGEEDGEDDDDEFMGLGEEMDSDGNMESDSGFSFGQDGEGDDNAEMSDGESGSIDPEVLSDDEDMDEDDETTPPQPNVHRSNRKADYLADDLFTAAFASQNSRLSKKSVEPTEQKTIRKRRRKTTTRAKDLVIGGRTIRTLPRTSDPRSQPTARSLPSARARKFFDQSLALKGKQALMKAKKRGWERRPANVGVMKYDGAPHGFARTTR